MSSARAVVVGASHAGAQLVTSLRQGGWPGEILLVGDEPVLPYQRPPLSKAYLAGKLGLTELALRSEDFYIKQDIKRGRHRGGD
jgi:3-phenylpropionate/trans-cinnamate dioxygenase ferredoxin reductase subunit